MPTKEIKAMRRTETSTSLDLEEVRRRVGRYEASDVTDRLYEFGRILVEANRDRTKQLEGKATMIVGYCLAVLVFLISRDPVDSVVIGWRPRLVVVAAILAALGLGSAFLALNVRTYRWLSDSQWFEDEDEVLDDPDRLKRCHVLALHSANSQLTTSNDRKADRIVAAQRLLLAAGLCLAGWIVFS